VSGLRFELLATDGGARAGTIHTPHGSAATPAFMPVGTRAAMKVMTVADLRTAGAGIVLANAYHLFQRPGADVVRDLGGLHRFMGWDGPMLTDSGGYQVFSLAERRKMDADGVTFKSEIDGNILRFTPESVIEIEEALGADIIMPLDHCIEFPAEKRDVARAVETTVAWARRSVAAKTRDDQALFPIVQGGVFADLRVECAEALTELDAPGYAAGGFSVGEPSAETWEVLDATTAALPSDRPRYLMGVGTPEDFLDAVACGIDMMDCVLPTRNARHKYAHTWNGTLRMRNLKHARDTRPLDADCPCATCRTHSRGYLRHLCQLDEPLVWTLLSVHNVTFMLELARDTRAAIEAGRFAAFRLEVLERLAADGA
jgi:queuine tRNA-ribosyltransferase